jgi:hypothetical protein
MPKRYSSRAPYLEGLNELKQRAVGMPQTFENEELLNFFQRYDAFTLDRDQRPRNITLHVIDERADSEGNYQRTFEDRLGQHVRLRFHHPRDGKPGTIG